MGSGQGTEARGDNRDRSFRPVGEWGCDLKHVVYVKLQLSSFFQPKQKKEKRVVSFDNSSKK